MKKSILILLVLLVNSVCLAKPTEGKEALRITETFLKLKYHFGVNDEEKECYVEVSKKKAGANVYFSLRVYDYEHEEPVEVSTTLTDSIEMKLNQDYVEFSKSDGDGVEGSGGKTFKYGSTIDVSKMKDSSIRVVRTYNNARTEGFQIICNLNL